jgi:hypothetical protein
MAEAPKQYESEKLEAQKRFEALPEKLKKEMLADKNVQLVSNICQDYSISEDKVKDVALLVGEVFLGYTKPEEIASELHQYFEIDMQKANFIEIELKQKLFNALKSDLDKVYNPPKITEEAQVQEESAPKVVNFEKEAAPLSAIPSQPAQADQPAPAIQKIPAMGTGTVSVQPQTTKPEQITSAPEISNSTQDKPFIIQTKTETIKPTIPQFTKESLSLNLKVEPSFAAKPVAPKPISVRLETEQASNVKFTMPVSPRPATDNLQQTAPIQQSKIETPAKPAAPIATPKPAMPQPVSQPITLKIDAQQEKPMSELKPVVEQPRTVHYSNFKTPLAPSGVPKKLEPKKEDYINLSTFTKISGNVVDLRSTKNEN